MRKSRSFFAGAIPTFLVASLFTNVPARGAIGIDANVVRNQGAAASSVTTPSFSTSTGNELLLAFVSTDGVSSPNITVTSVTGAGLTWVLVRRTNVQLGTSEIWRAFAPSPLTSVTVRATLSQSVSSLLTVMSFTGVDTSGSNGSGAIGQTGTGNANPGAPTTSLVTTRDGSLVLGVGNDWDRPVSRTLGPGQTLVSQYLPPVGDTYWVQRQTNTTPLSGTMVTINDTAPTTDRYNLTIVEVLPAAVVNTTPDLSIAKTHAGTFVQGQTGASYAITVTNSGGTATSGTVSVNDTLPASLTATTISGSGWTCTTAPTLGCTRSDTLAAGASYPVMSLTVNVASNAPASVINTATVSGGGEANTSNNTATDVTTINTPPDLTITKSHAGSFTQGQTGAIYSIAVTNSGGAATAGTVTVTDTLPAGLTATAIAGTGWSCTTSPTLGCTRSSALAAGASYPVITLTVNVANGAPASVTNTVTVSGGAEINTSNDAANDLTAINAPSDLSIAKTHLGNFTQGQTGASYSITVTNSGGAATSGTVTVTDTLPASLTPTAIAGTAWTCTTAPTLGCTRSDALTAGASYPAITLTVNVASNVPASVTNTAAVSGGGDINPSNNTANDVTNIDPLPDLTITKSHVGTFTQGQTGATYSITVTNNGGAATSGTVTVTDTLPASLAPAAIAGTGWSCTISPTLGCTRSDALTAGASYPAITLTVSVASNALASVTNTATVSGGGETNASNDAANDNTVINPAGGASTIAVDVSISMDQSGASTSIVTPAFSTVYSNELLLAFVSADYSSGSSTTVTGISGGAPNWVLVQRTNAQLGTAEIWRAFAPSPLNNVTVRATLSQGVAASLTVMSFTGVDVTGTNGSGAIGAIGSGNGNPGAPTATLVTTRSGSIVFGVGTDWDKAIGRTVGPGQNLVHQYLATVGDTYWIQRQSSPTPTSGISVTISDTAPATDRYNLSIIEVLPSTGGGGGGGGTPPTVSMVSPAPNQTVTSKTTVAANASSTSFAISSLQFLLDGANLGAPVTLAPYSMTWDTATTTAGAHTLSAKASDSAGNATTSAPITVTVDNSGNPAVVGSWSAPVTTPTVAVNLILLENGNVLFYQDGTAPTVWNYTTNVFTNIATSVNLFCSGHALLSDGRILVVGGYGGSSSAIGIANAELFDPSTNRWAAVPNMSYSRWYPTATTLSDGRILVTAGWQTTQHSNAGIPEIYDPATNQWTRLTNANNPFETYPFIFQLPDGQVLHVGGSEYATVTEGLDLNSQTWRSVDARLIDGASATMYLPNKILKAGSAADSQEVGPSSNTAFVLDMTQPSPTWQQVPSMAYPRSFMNLTELPDGTVLATGGETDKDGGNIANAVYAAELWSPVTQTWTTMASMHTPREYHGTALLLPDGRVLQSGMGADFGNVPDQKSAEFYSPPYLFKGVRPAITQSPAAGITYGQNFFVGTPDGATITSAVLIRTGAVTHFFDENTRFVPVTFTQAAGGLTITAPVNGNQAPPGYYMLFLVNSSGVPSIAPILQLHP